MNGAGVAVIPLGNLIKVSRFLAKKKEKETSARRRDGVTDTLLQLRCYAAYNAEGRSFPKTS